MRNTTEFAQNAICDTRTKNDMISIPRYTTSKEKDAVNTKRSGKGKVWVVKNDLRKEKEK